MRGERSPKGVGIVQDSLRFDSRTSFAAGQGGLFVSAGMPINTLMAHEEFELVFVRKGPIEIVEGADTHRVEENQTFLVWPDQQHGVMIPEGEASSFYYILFGMERHGRTSGQDTITLPKQLTITQPERLIELLHRYVDDQRTDRLSPVMGSHLVALMLCEVGRSAIEEERTVDRGASLVDMIQVHIARNYHEPISTSTMAAELRYNPDYLERVFHTYTGISITEAIHRKRIKEARRLLMHDYKNVSEIACACGFKDSGYFRRVFKRHTDMTPTKFRTLYSQVHLRIA